MDEFGIWLGFFVLIAVFSLPLSYLAHLNQNAKTGEQKPFVELPRGRASASAGDQVTSWIGLAVGGVAVAAAVGFATLTYAKPSASAGDATDYSGSWKSASGRIYPGTTLYTQDHQPYGVVQVQVTTDQDGDEAVLLRLTDGRPFLLKRKAIRDNPTIWLVRE